MKDFRALLVLLTSSFLVGGCASQDSGKARETRYNPPSDIFVRPGETRGLRFAVPSRDDIRLPHELRVAIYLLPPKIGAIPSTLNLVQAQPGDLHINGAPYQPNYIQRVTLPAGKIYVDFTITPYSPNHSYLVMVTDTEKDANGKRAVGFSILPVLPTIKGPVHTPIGGGQH